MKIMITSLLAVSFSLSLPAFAELRELSQTDLRHAVSTDRAIASHQLFQNVETQTGGTVISMRAFAIEDDITFRLLVRYDSGMLDAIMIDGLTGEIIPATTQIAARVSAFAEASQ